MTAPASVREAILKRCARGMSYRAISRELAASYSTVRRIGNDAGFRRQVGRPSLIDEHEARAIELLVPELGVGVTARLLGLEWHSVRIEFEKAASLGREGSPGADVPSAGIISGPSTPIGALRASYGPAMGRPRQELA